MRNGQALVYVYARETQAEADIAKVLTFDEARRIAVYVAKLPELLQSADARSRILCETGNGTYITGRNLDWNDTTAKNRPLGVPNEHPLVRLDRCPAYISRSARQQTLRNRRLGSKADVRLVSRHAAKCQEQALTSSTEARSALSSAPAACPPRDYRLRYRLDRSQSEEHHLVLRFFPPKEVITNAHCNAVADVQSRVDGCRRSESTYKQLFERITGRLSLMRALDVATG
jgi:hypothetical protein